MPAAPSADPTGRPLRGLCSPHRLAIPHRRRASTTGRCESPALLLPTAPLRPTAGRPATDRSAYTLIAPLPDRTGDRGTGRGDGPLRRAGPTARAKSDPNLLPTAPFAESFPSPEALPITRPGAWTGSPRETRLSPFGRPAPNGLPCWQPPRRRPNRRFRLSRRDPHSSPDTARNPALITKVMRTPQKKMPPDRPRSRLIRGTRETA